MKTAAIVRNMDDLGRVVIPKEVRKTLGIEEKDPMGIYVDDGGEIILKKYNPACIFCGSDNYGMQHKDKNVCKDCLDSIGKGK